MGRTLTVKYKFSQGAEDLYWCLDTKKMYVRAPANVDDIVFWLTSVKWVGGYEADCPIKEGTNMKVVDKNGEVIFSETLEKDDWNGGTSAKKKGDFADEAIRKIACEVGEKMSRKKDIHTSRDWREWLLEDKSKFDYKDYDDNWLYFIPEVIKTKRIGKKTYLGKEVYIEEYKIKHTISGKKWTEYLVLSEDRTTVYRSAGYSY